MLIIKLTEYFTLYKSLLSWYLAQSINRKYKSKTRVRTARTAAWFNGENFRNTDEKSIVFGGTKKEVLKIISVVEPHLHSIEALESPAGISNDICQKGQIIGES